MYVEHAGGGGGVGACGEGGRARYLAATEDFVYLAQRLYIVTAVLEPGVVVGRGLNLRKQGGFVLVRTGRLLLVALHADPESPGAVLHAVRALRRKLVAEGF